MHKNIRGLATTVKYRMIAIINHRGKDLLYLLSISSSSCMRLTIGTLVIYGNFLKMKLDFTFVMSVSLKLDTILNKTEFRFRQIYDYIKLISPKG